MISNVGTVHYGYYDDDFIMRLNQILYLYRFRMAVGKKNPRQKHKQDKQDQLLTVYMSFFFKERGRLCSRKYYMA